MFEIFSAISKEYEGCVGHGGHSISLVRFHIAGGGVTLAAIGPINLNVAFNGML